MCEKNLAMRTPSRPTHPGTLTLTHPQAEEVYLTGFYEQLRRAVTTKGGEWPDSPLLLCTHSCEHCVVLFAQLNWRGVSRAAKLAKSKPGLVEKVLDLLREKACRSRPTPPRRGAHDGCVPTPPPPPRPRLLQLCRATLVGGGADMMVGDVCVCVALRNEQVVWWWPS